MKLVNFQVTNFHSIIDSGRVNISDITVLIGSNQAGKSGILQGLASISTESSYKDFDLTQLEGISKRYFDGELKAQDIPIIEGVFNLSTEEKELLKDVVGIPAEDIKEELIVTKYYDNHYSVIIHDTSYHIPSKSLLMSTLSQISSTLTNLQTNVGNQHTNHSPNDQFVSQFNYLLTELKRPFANLPLRANALNVLSTESQKFLAYGIDQNFKNEVGRVITTLQQLVVNCFPNTEKEIAVYNFISSHLPKTVYFKSYDILEDDVSIAELAKVPEKHKTFLNLLSLAGLKIEALSRITNEKQRQAYVENASGQATKLLRSAWKQEDLQLQLRYQGDRIMVFTKDSSAVETLLPPSSGSEGFQWFLGFYINFGAATNAEYKDAILLLDDPGVFLHPNGHKDLLRLFESYLTSNITTIYTTHLPFLIARDKLERMRLVEKVSEGRTKISERFYAAANKDVLFPLRAALGVSLGDSLFVGNKTIVAEGLSERILLTGMLRELGKKGFKKLNGIEDIEILAGVGADGLSDYAVLLQLNQLPYVVVLDNDEKGRTVASRLKSSGIPEEKVILIQELTDGDRQNYDIEDLFSTELYAKAVYGVYGKDLKMTESDIIKTFEQGKEKLSNKAKTLLTAHRLSLDKKTMAEELLRIISQQTDLDHKTRKNFGNLFDQIDQTISLFAK